MIEINVSSKMYPAQGMANQHLAIADFKLSLHEHEFVCLVGSSGCGKTTLLNIIAELDQDYQGSINFAEWRREHKIGYIFQNPRLLPWRTVRENIELAFSGESDAATIDVLLDVMQLSKFQHVYPERLSLGMSRRVAIIRAFAINPDLLLMDEPFVSLDAATAKQSKSLLLNLWAQRPHTVLFVTHDLREAIALADRIIFLTAAPMQIMKEVAVTIPRVDRDNEQVIEAFREELLNESQTLKQ